MRKKVLLTLRVLATGAILFALFKFVPYKKLVLVYQDSQKSYLYLGFIFFLLCQIIGVFRWRFLLASLGTKISIREAFYAYFSGLFLNLFFPSFVAGDVFRSYCISYRYGDKSKVASSVLMDRFSGAIALTLVALMAFIAGRSLMPKREVLITLFILCVIAGLSSLVIFSKNFFLFLMKIFKERSGLRDKLISFHDRLYSFRNNPLVFIKSLGISFLIQILMASGFFIIAQAFAVEVSINYFLIIVPLVTAIALIPITIAGAGTREAAAVYFFSLIGIEKSIGLGISLMNLIFLVSMSIAGGIFYVSVYHRWLQSHSR